VVFGVGLVLAGPVLVMATTATLLASWLLRGGSRRAVYVYRPAPPLPSVRLVLYPPALPPDTPCAVPPLHCARCPLRCPGPPLPSVRLALSRPALALGTPCAVPPLPCPQYPLRCLASPLPSVCLALSRPSLALGTPCTLPSRPCPWYPLCSPAPPLPSVPLVLSHPSLALCALYALPPLARHHQLAELVRMFGVQRMFSCKGLELGWEGQKRCIKGIIGWRCLMKQPRHALRASSDGVA
jgi:hypothetical protein